MSSRLRGLTWTAIAVAALTTQVALARADGGALDPTFGTFGLTITPNPPYVGTEGSDLIAVALQSDGKIVVGGHIHPAGSPRQAFTLERYTAAGSLDPSFGSNGVVITDLGNEWEQVRGLAIQPDGKIVAAGVDGGALALARYTADGTLDPTFGGGAIPGTVVDGSLSGGAEDVVLQTDGKIVVAGGLQGMSLARYDANGILDAGFGAGGVVSPPLRNWEYAKAVAVEPDGRIVVAGSRSNSLPDAGPDRSFLVERFNPDGSADLGFGSGGAATASVATWDYGNAVALQPDGRILVAGTPEIDNVLDFGLVRFQADGALDQAFGDHGIVITGDTKGHHVGGASAVLSQPDGKIVVAGDGSSKQGGSDFAFARYLPDGSLDPSFGAGGVVATHFGATPHGGGSSGILRAVALQPDGKIVAVGPIVPSDPSGGGNSFGVARYLGSDSHELSVGKPFSSGFGSVTSLPLGIACDLECDEDAAQFADQSPVTLTANPSAGSWPGRGLALGAGPYAP